MTSKKKKTVGFKIKVEQLASFVGENNIEKAIDSRASPLVVGDFQQMKRIDENYPVSLNRSPKSDNESNLSSPGIVFRKPGAAYKSPLKLNMIKM